MAHALSVDGTPIAYHVEGSGGPLVVVVNGAFSTARDGAGFAVELAEAGLVAVTYDRRARGESGDTRPYAPEREAEDLAAVIGAAGAGAAGAGAAGAGAAGARAAGVTVVGHSSGAVLALFAASLGVPIGRLFLSEPPFHFDEDEAPSDLPARLQELVDSGRGADAVTAFQLEAIGLQPTMVDQIRSSPMFESLVALAQSVVYDATLTRQVPTPTDAMLNVAQPTTVLSGAETFPFLRSASERLTELMPGAEFVEVAESVGHRLDAVATTRLIVQRLHAA